MPIYEYHCASCHRVFEKMRPMSRADDAIACPECGGTDTSRGLSRCASFSRGSDGSTHAVSGGGSCQGCGSHSCGSCGRH
ncbi:MAG: zinc ribbon domain-containing protein [Anaerolineae bacterium]|nr:zinc ribbon domain-containing protein [Anaerolineae bacterium]